MNDNETEQLLTQTLHAEAGRIETSPGALQEIQARTGKASARRHRWVWAAGAASLATAAVVTGVVVLAQDDGGSTGATGAPNVEQPREGDLTAVYNVWLSGAQPGNPEGPGPGDPSVFAPLYVEQHIDDADFAGSIEKHAVHTFLTTKPWDPDYSTGWPAGVDVEKVTKKSGETTIALTGSADLDSRGDLTSGQAQSAIQALLRTADASGEATFTYNGQPLERLFGVATPVEVLPFGDGTQDSLRAPIWVDVNEGQSVDNPVTIPVWGNAPEGTVNWELLDDSGNAVDEGFVTAGSTEWAKVNAKLGTLAPGTYTFRAFEVSLADGDETYVDTKTFVVE